MVKLEENFIFFELEKEQTKLDIRLYNDSLWLSLNQILILFERDKSVISRHLRNIFEKDGLDKNLTIAYFATVQTEGKRKINRSIY